MTRMFSCVWLRGRLPLGLLLGWVGTRLEDLGCEKMRESGGVLLVLMI